ncbi:MAG: hypothetical protein J6K05_09955 [Bacteroidaceae bacterium]|nr:hypothetical protein [Bacteroidaceae bacterium]
MKTLRMFGMAIVAVLLCTNFAACSDDDDDDSSIMLENGNVLINGHEAVDLGLSVKWATCNVGASKPEDYGGYYAWGETTTKSYYSWKTYKWCNGTDGIMTKYCTDEGDGTVDNRTVLTSSDDVATVKWGKKWRMPTGGEMKELVEYCTWTWTTQNGVEGMKVTGSNGNSIFLPAAGYRGGTALHDRGYGCYWSATLYDVCVNAYSLGFHYSYYDLDSWGDRYHGFTVRPVTE